MSKTIKTLKSEGEAVLKAPLSPKTDAARARETEGVVCQTHVGGQALIEGIMMRGKYNWAVAVREPSGNIYLEEHDLVSGRDKNSWMYKPLVRGCTAMVESLALGYQALQIAAEHAFDFDEDEEQQEEEHHQDGEKVGDFLPEPLTPADELAAGHPAAPAFAADELAAGHPAQPEPTAEPTTPVPTALAASESAPASAPAASAPAPADNGIPKGIMTVSMIIGLLLGVVIFIVLPAIVTNL
ncbi:MAG: DUF1385 domain-containing protein, partial [Coriobacteriales bacterium]|nr:DUF1385 domain-containing protein [Coriobacteriales bacterium]